MKVLAKNLNLKVKYIEKYFEQVITAEYDILADGFTKFDDANVSLTKRLHLTTYELEVPLDHFQWVRSGRWGKLGTPHLSYSAKDSQFVVHVKRELFEALAKYHDPDAIVSK